MKKVLLIGVNLAMACVFSAAANARAVIELKPIETVKIKPVESIQPGTTGKVLDFSTTGNRSAGACSASAVSDTAAKFAKDGINFSKAERVLKAGVVPMNASCATEAADMQSVQAKSNLIDIADCALDLDVMAKNTSDRLGIYSGCAAKVMGVELQTAAANVNSVIKDCGYLAGAR